MMRKMFFTLVLAIAGSVWTMSEAMCQVGMCTCLWNEPPVSLTGTLDLVSLPCPVTDNEEYPCLPCLTTALSVGDTMYYLTNLYGDLEVLLDTLTYPVTATVTGYVFASAEDENAMSLDVRSVSLEKYRLPSLCDTWNVLHEPFSCDGPYCYLRTLVYRLTTDTIIQNKHYIKLMEQEGTYTYHKGALREGTNRDIYYVPENSTHEYLIYAFNAQVGDTLTNLWIGGWEEYYPEGGYTGVVAAVSGNEGSLRTYRIDVNTPEGNDQYSWPIYWTEGVGSPEEPCGLNCPTPCMADGGVYTLLCAYKNGEQVYSSSKAERYGCEFNGYVPFNSVPPVQSTEEQCTKLLRDGQLLILRGEKTYTVTGQEVK